MNLQTTQVTVLLIDGATGYIGSHFIASAQKTKTDLLSIRCLARKTANTSDISFLKGTGVLVFQADLKDDSVNDAFSQVDVAYHLIGSIAPRRGETSESLHIDQTKHFVESCLKAKVKKIIMVSACGAAPDAISEYHRTKWQAEQIIERSGIPSIILRPSLVLGKGIGQRNSKLVNRIEELIRNKKIVPLIGGGKNKVQPLYINDLVEAMLASAQLTALPNKLTILELGGPDILTLKDLAQNMMIKMETTRPILDLPIPAANAIAQLAELTQEVPIVSRDQIKLSQKDNVCQNNYLSKLLKNPPTSLNEALDSYQWTKN